MDISIISVSSMRIYRCSGSMYSTVPVRVTSSVLKEAMRKYLQNQEKHKVKKEAKKAEKSVPRGKQTVGKLMNQRQGLTNIEITNRNIKSFERVANKY